MIFRFFHNKENGHEWYIIRQLSNGSYLSICTRPSSTYKLGCIRNFFFDDKDMWTKGKYRLKPENNSLTNLNLQHGKPRDANR